MPPYCIMQINFQHIEFHLADYLSTKAIKLDSWIVCDNVTSKRLAVKYVCVKSQIKRIKHFCKSSGKLLAISD